MLMSDVQYNVASKVGRQGKANLKNSETYISFFKRNIFPAYGLRSSGGQGGSDRPSAS